MKLPTGGNTQADFRAGFSPRAARQDSGVIPEPTVIVRMNEGPHTHIGKAPRAIALLYPRNSSRLAVCIGLASAMLPLPLVSVVCTAPKPSGCGAFCISRIDLCNPLLLISALLARRMD